MPPITKPTQEAFGITSAELHQVDSKNTPWQRAEGWIITGGGLVLGLLAAVAVGVTSRSVGDGAAIGAVVLFGGWILLAIIFTVFESQLLERQSVYRKVKRYKDALRHYVATQEQYWLGLRGISFERELGSLYQRLGYNVKYTSTSGDEGIDLVIDSSTIVQCKGHKTPVGPAIVRELYGTLTASGASNAILACPAGFTRGAQAFAAGKPIELLSATAIVALAENTAQADEIT